MVNMKSEPQCNNCPEDSGEVSMSIPCPACQRVVEERRGRLFAIFFKLRKAKTTDATRWITSDGPKTAHEIYNHAQYIISMGEE